MLLFCFIVPETATSAKNIWVPVIENIVILGFLMADTSSKLLTMYIFGELCHTFTLYWVRIMFLQLIIYRKKYFRL